MRGMMRNLPKLEHVMVPVLVLGDQRDGTVSIEELHSTARAYRTTAEVFPNMGHDMMLEPGWATVAERIHNWLTASGLWPRNDALDADLQPALRVTDRHAAPGPSNPLLIIQQQLICSHCRRYRGWLRPKASGCKRIRGLLAWVNTHAGSTTFAD